MNAIVLLEGVVSDLEVVRDQATRIVAGLSERAQDQVSIAHDVSQLERALEESRRSVSIAMAQLDGHPVETPAAETETEAPARRPRPAKRSNPRKRR